MLQKLNSISAWGIFLIGFIHISGLFWFFVYLVEPGTAGVAREPVLWWAVGGITLWLGGGLNLLRLHYGQVARGIVPITLAANVVMVVFEVWLEVNNPGFLTPLRMLLLVFQVLATLFTIGALRHPSHAPA